MSLLAQRRACSTGKVPIRSLPTSHTCHLLDAFTALMNRLTLLLWLDDTAGEAIACRAVGLRTEGHILANASRGVRVEWIAKAVWCIRDAGIRTAHTVPFKLALRFLVW